MANETVAMSIFVSNDSVTVGIFDESGVQGTKSFAGVPKHIHGIGTRLAAFSQWINQIIDRQRYGSLICVAPRYSVNSRAFYEADYQSRLLGIAQAAFALRKLRVDEVDWSDVYAMAGVRKLEESQDRLLEAATRNGVKISSPCVAAAYWTLLAGKRGKADE